MQKKQAIVAGISVVVVIAAIMGGIVLHKNSETVEVMAEAAEPLTEEASPVSTKKTEEIAEEPQTVEIENAEETAENVADTEQETDVLQGNDREQEKAKPHAAEISEDDGIEEIDAYMYTTADLNIRKEGTTESEVIGSIPYGTEIHVTARTADNWYRTERGEVGYVSGKYLSDTKPQQNASAQQSSDSTGNSASSGGNSGDTSGGNSGGNGGAPSSVPGISQSQMDSIDAALSGLQMGTPAETGGHEAVGFGGLHLNQ